MPSDIDRIKGAILEAIKKDSFTASEILSQYKPTEVAEALTAVLYDRRVSKDDNRVNLSESELQNIYLLARTIITKDMVHNKEREPKASKCKGAVSGRSSQPPISDRTLAFMYRLQAAH